MTGRIELLERRYRVFRGRHRLDAKTVQMAHEAAAGIVLLDAEFGAAIPASSGSISKREAGTGAATSSRK
ncbi:MAG: hypothetical protein A49_15890 [Methyloceanibacter sp.]|nr:MAG: hypothetical protein A49_15890 [Methyloceanibacter sp.]